MSSTKKHPYHLVDPSPWPLVTSIGVLLTAIGGVLAMRGIDKYLFLGGLATILYAAYCWWRDVVKESNQSGVYTKEVQTGLRIGMVLFIASEVMFFAAFFWGYFDAALFPMDAIGNTWPPKNVETLDPFHLPYLNTLILLLSGTTVTWAHHELVHGNMKDTTKALLITVLLGLIFTCVQAFEYMHATFKFTDGIYSSVFYMSTGFHGVHVIIGTAFLMVCLFRSMKKKDFTPKQHVGFEAAAWYWHFVDVVWLFLFIAIYWWGYQ